MARAKAKAPTFEGYLALILAAAQAALVAMDYAIGPWMATAWWAVACALGVDWTWRADLTRRLSRIARATITALLLVVLGLLTWFSFWRAESPLDRDTLPGFSATFATELRGAMVDRKQYLFDFRTQEGARAAFFLAANGSHFTFEINDVHGEAHSLDAPVSDEGLKISEPIILVVQLGVSDTATYMQIVADGRDVAHETINFPLDLGSKDWIKHGTIMADRDHKNFAAFSIQYLRVAHATWTKPHYTSHTRNVRKLVSDLQKGADHLLANPPPK